MKGRIVVIGASLNGINALRALVGSLPKSFPAAIFVVQHVAPHSPGVLPLILSEAGPLSAVHPQDHDPIIAGKIYVAPPDRHMLIRDGRIRLAHGPKENLARPAIDPLFRSAALTYGAAVVGVVLTGQLDDGTAGLLAVKDRGGVAIVQEPAEATAPSMPLSAIRHVQVDHRAPVKTIAALLVTLANDAPSGPEPPIEDLLAIEDRIAEGQFTVDDWYRLERLATPSGLNCPDCRSALYEINDSRLLRFRCRSGHAFSAESLMSGQSDARGNLLSSLFGALIEESTLAKKVGQRAEYVADVASRVRLAEQSVRLDAQADEICTWLRATAGLVEPEPVLAG